MAITARITYWLSESGRRDSLRHGGNGQREQTQVGAVPSEGLDAFKVDEQGEVVLEAKLLPDTLLVAAAKWHVSKIVRGRPGGSTETRFEVEWDSAPTWDDLLAFARLQHDAWHAYEEQMIDAAVTENAASTTRAEAFLADPNARAETVAEHYVTIGGYDFWDPKVVEEAKRRWLFDQEERRKLNRATLAAWIYERGSDNQQQRLKAGLLPWQEAHDTVEQAQFAPLEAFKRYERFKVEDVCACHLAGEAPCGVKFQSVDATELKAEEWEIYRQLQATVPDAMFQLREHRAKCRSRAETEVRRGVIVKRTIGALTFKLEFALGGPYDAR